MIALPNKKYNIIYADPPWSYNDKMHGHSFSIEPHYQTQNKQWVAGLPIGEIAADNCALFLWSTSPLLNEGLEVLRAWGFRYVTVAFCWSKKTKTGKNVSNLGRWTMGNVELCLLGRKGKLARKTYNVKQLVEAERTTHSTKPPEIRDRIVELLGDLPRIELFARERTDGWDAWGDQLT